MVASSGTRGRAARGGKALSRLGGYPERDDGGLFAANKADKRRVRSSTFHARITKGAQGANVNKKRRRPGKKLTVGMDGLLGALPDIAGSAKGADGLSRDKKVDDKTNRGAAVEEEWEGVSDVSETDELDTRVANNDALQSGLWSQQRRRQRIALRAEAAGHRGSGAGVQKMKMKTLKSRPGATKRRSRLETAERDRFARNLAQLSANASNVAVHPSATGALPGADAQTSAIATDTSSNARKSVPAMTPAAIPTNTRPSTTADRWAALRGFIDATMEKQQTAKGGQFM
ncbi:hypothetical protein LTR66_000304 [Elasticomyces elasticus]|nr:hypothetical protein LTR66_000304 [Elasticomyces elasticus]